MAELGFRLAGKIFGIRGQHAGTAFDEQDSGLLGIDVAELVIHSVVGDFGEGSGKFDTGGTASDHHELQRRSAVASGSLTLGQFEGQENTAADFEGVFNRL